MNLYSSYEEDTGESFIYIEHHDTSNLLAVDANCGKIFIISDCEEEVEIIQSFDPKYLPKGGVGYAESITLTFDGDIEGKTMFGNQAVKISDELYDLSIFAKARGYLYGKPIEITMADCSIEKNINGYIDGIYSNGIIIAFVVYENDY